MERAIRYVRDAFFAARRFNDLDDLNVQAEHWCRDKALQRPCPEDAAITVGAALAVEKPRLLALPDTPFPTEDHMVVTAGKTPYVRFDLNDYSIPHTHVRRQLEVRASLEQVRVFDGGSVIARHARSYDRGQVVEQPEHVAALVAHKRQARQHRAVSYLTHAVPLCQELLAQAAQRGDAIGSISATLLDLLAQYGAAELAVAVKEALAAGVPHPNAVRLALERRRTARGSPPPVALVLPEHVRRRDMPVPPHRLDSYDQLTKPEDDDDEPGPA